MHAEDARLRRVQDRGRHQRSVHPAVRDRERSALEIVDRKRAIARLLSQGGDSALDSGETQGVGVAHHGNDEAPLAADGDADVVVILEDQILPIDLGVDRRYVLQGGDAGFDEKAHEAELHAVAFLEDVLVLTTERHHRGHIHLVEGGEHGGGLLRLLQPARDRLAQPRHPHAVFAFVDFPGRGRRRRDGRRRPCFERRQGVALGDPTVPAIADDLRRIELCLRDNPLDRWRKRQVLTGRRLRRGRGLRRLRIDRGGRGRGRRRRDRGGSGFDARGGTGLRAGARPKLTEPLAGNHGGALLGLDSAQNAVGESDHFETDLVGLEFHQDVVALDRVAGLFRPARHRSLGDGLAEERVS